MLLAWVFSCCWQHWHVFLLTKVWHKTVDISSSHRQNNGNIKNLPRSTRTWFFACISLLFHATTTGCASSLDTTFVFRWHFCTLFEWTNEQRQALAVLGNISVSERGFQPTENTCGRQQDLKLISKKEVFWRKKLSSRRNGFAISFSFVGTTIRSARQTPMWCWECRSEPEETPLMTTVSLLCVIDTQK